MVHWRRKWQPTPVFLPREPHSESESESEVAQSSLTLCDPMDCSPPGSSIHGISQGRILESRLPFPSLGDLPDTGIEFMSHAWAGRVYTTDPQVSQCHISLPFYTAHGVFKESTLKWFAIPFSSEPCFVGTLHHDPSVLGGPTRHGS